MISLVTGLTPGGCSKGQGVQRRHVDTRRHGGPVAHGSAGAGCPRRRACEGIFPNIRTPFFDWEESQTTGDVFDYRLVVVSGDINAGPIFIDVVVPHPTTEFQAPTGDALPDGVYQWRVAARERALNTASSVKRTFTVDTVAPSPPGLVSPADAPARESFLSTRTPFFDWNVSTGDPFEYRLLVTSGDILGGPFDVDVVVSGDKTEFQVPTGDDLNDDVYQWRVISRDLALNTASSVVRTFTLDAVVPGAPGLVAPEADPTRASFLNTRTPTFEWTVSAGTPFDYRLLVSSGDIDLGPFDVDRLVLHPVTGDQVTLTGDGRYQWRVVARDAALNTASSVTRTFTVDTLAPAEPVLVLPEDAPARGSFLNTRTPFFDWNESATTGDVFEYLLQVTSGGSFAQPRDIEKLLLHPFTEFQVPTGDALNTGDYQWRVISRDKAFNAGTSDTRTFTVDTLAPAGPVLVAPEDKALLRDRTPLFDWEDSVTTADLFDYVLLVASGDIVGGPFDIKVVITGDTTEFQVPTGDALADDTYRWRVIARDAAINTASSVTRSFTVDATPPGAPELLLPPVGAFLNTGAVLFDWDGSALSPAVQHGVGGFPRSLTLGDLDGDGDLDVVVANSSTDNVSVLLNSGDGRFGDAENIAAGDFPISVVGGDLDGDGDLDLVVANFNDLSVSVLLNSGDGRFGSAEAHGVGGKPRSVTVGEVDGDGDLDLVVANGSIDKVSVLLNSGDGRFGVAEDFGAGDLPISVVAGDLDGDGDLDLAVANFNDLSVSVLLNSGDGRFGPAEAHGVGGKPRSVMVGDVDGDGDLDLVVANGSIDKLSVLLNSGDGRFGVAENFGVGDLPISVVGVDLDADGDLDLVVANQLSNNVTALLNDGSGAFVVAENFGVGVNPFHVAGGDLDGDGDIDLVTANNQGNDVSVLLNRFTWDVEEYVLEVVKSGDGFGVRPFAIEEVISGDRTEFQVGSADALADTIYRWRVIARDKVLNVGTSDQRSFTVDTISPTVPGIPTDVTITADALVREFTWDQSTDPVPPSGTTGDESGVDFYNVVITGPVNIVATADDSEAVCPAGVCGFTTPTLTPGEYTIQVTAVDRATNESVAATEDFRAGSLAVVQNLAVVDPVFGTTVNVPNPAFRWNPPPQLPDPSDTGDGGILTYEVAITGDSPALPSTSDLRVFRSFTDPNFFVAECFKSGGAPIGTGDACRGAIGSGDRIQIRIEGPGIPEGLPDGTHLLRVRVVPQVGTIGNPVELTFTVDTTAPVAPELVRPVSGDRTNDNTPFFEWTPSSGDIFDYRLLVTSGDIVGGPFDLDVVVLHPGTGHEATVPLGDGLYQWRVVAGDRALNTASSITRPFTVDATPPATPELVKPQSGDRFNAARVEFEWRPSTSDDIFSYRLQVTTADGDINTDPLLVDRELLHPITGDVITLSGDGVYQWRVGAKDDLGNEIPTVSLEVRVFQVDRVPPRRSW